jgi:hypothetical protein
MGMVSGAGVSVGEGTVFHPQVGIETGVVSNVFYQQDGPVTAGLLRIIAEVGTGSLPSQRLSFRTTGDDQDPATPQTQTAPSTGDLQYSADLYATWDQYLSTNNNVNAQGGLGGGLLLRGLRLLLGGGLRLSRLGLPRLGLRRRGTRLPRFGLGLLGAGL